MLLEKDVQQRFQLMLNKKFKLSGDRLASIIRKPQEADFWQADHVVAVKEGGGLAELSNYQTLCTPCHEGKTNEQSSRKRAHASAKGAEGSGDIRQAFAGGKSKGSAGAGFAPQSRAKR